MRIIGIDGVWRFHGSIWIYLEYEFRRVLDVSAFHNEYELNGHPWQVSRFRKMGERIVRKYDDGMDTLLVGHSLGGVVACGIADRFKKSRILGVVTIFSPHRFPFKATTHIVGSRKQISVPIITFRAYRDPLVLWGTRHPQSIAHTALWCNHYTDIMYKPNVPETIARVTKEVLFPEA